MKKTLLIVITLAIGIFAISFARAQGTLFVSNLGQTPTGSASIGSDAWIAQPFGTGTNVGGYVLNSVQLLMDTASGSPSGFTVSIYNQSGSSPFPPMNIVSSLSGSDPSAGGIFTYTASNLTLLPSTLYFVVINTTTPVAQGAYNWSAAGLAGYASQWIIEPNHYSSSDGSNWNFSRPQSFQLGIYATPIPEPATGALFAISLAYLGFLRLRQTK